MKGKKITIELSQLEAEMCLEYCWLRVTKEAIKQIEAVQSIDDQTAHNLEDLATMGPLIESIRTKIREALSQEGHLPLNPI